MRLAFAAALMLVASPALATEYDCEGIFAQDTTLAAIEAAFGKENVVTGEVPGAEGEMFTATTIYPGDAEREMQARWWDEENLTEFAGVTLGAGDVGPGGVHAGMPIEEVEAINGEPFGLMGFYWDYGGGAGFTSGKLTGLPGGCHLTLQLSPTLQQLPEDVELAISGDVELRSDMPVLRQARVAVDFVSLSYPYPQPSLADLSPLDIAALIDVTSFRTSIESQEGIRTFGDYGFTQVDLVDGRAELYVNDRSWIFAITVLEASDDTAVLCVLDKALGGPSYDAQSAIAFARDEDGMLVASDEDVQDPDCPGRP